MRRGFSSTAIAVVVACAIYAPANAAGSPDAVYSNLGTFRDESFAPGGATLQPFNNTITRLAADDLNLVGTPPYSINGFRFIVTNLNAVDVSARVQVRFYRPNGVNGGPGDLLESRTYNPIVFHAGVVGTIKTSSQFPIAYSSIWAGIAFDNANGTTGATAEHLDNLALGIFSPAEVGTSADQYFLTAAAGPFSTGHPAGTITDFSGSPPADFGWEILTAQNVDLSITKSDGVTTTFAGGTVVYTITASNAGPDTVFDARVVDNFPTSLSCSWTCAGSPGNTCAASGTGNISDGTVDLAVGGSVTYTATCTVSPTATGTLENTAAFFAPRTALETATLNNFATDSDAILAGPDLTIAKSHAGNFTQGQPGTYSLTVTNVGGSPTSGPVSILDNVPSGLLPIAAAGAGWTCNVVAQAVLCSRGDSLAAGASYPAITLAVAVAADAPASVTNTAVVFGGSDTDPVNNSDPDPTTIGAGPDLTLGKSHTGNFTQGQSGSYTLIVTNNGAAPTTGPLTVTDNVPSELVPTSATGTGWTCDVAAQDVTCNRNDSLGPGASYPPITLTATVQPDAPASVINTATVSGGGDVDSTNDSASDPTTILAVADLTITKTHTGSFLQGQVGATYTLTVKNDGGGPTIGTVTVEDTLPSDFLPTAASGIGWGCAIAGQDVTCSRSDALLVGASYPAITITVTVAAMAGPSSTNTAEVSGGGQFDTTNDTAMDITTVGPGPDVTIDKSHTGDFSQGLVGAVYTLNVSNTGGAPTGSPVTVSDTVPAGLIPVSAAGTNWNCNIAGQLVTCVNLAALLAGQSYPITLTVDVEPTAPGSVSNTATVSGGGDVNALNNSDTDVTTIAAGADLTVTKSHIGNFTQGQAGATYTLTVENVGAGSTSGPVTVIDKVPVGLVPTAVAGTGWTCNPAGQEVICSRSDSLGPGASYPEITLTVAVAVDAPTSVTNTAIVFGGGATNPANNADSDPTTIGAGPDLTLAKSHTDTFTQGQTATYVLTVSNIGGATTSGPVTVTDNLPAGLVPTAATGAGWSCGIAAQGVLCNTSDPLPSGQSYPVITLTVNVQSNAPGSVINTATVIGGGGVDPTNNSASDLTTIAAATVAFEIPTLRGTALLVLLLLIAGMGTVILRGRSS